MSASMKKERWLFIAGTTPPQPDLKRMARREMKQRPRLSEEHQRQICRFLGEVYEPYDPEEEFKTRCWVLWKRWNYKRMQERDEEKRRAERAAKKAAAHSARP